MANFWQKLSSKGVLLGIVLVAIAAGIAVFLSVHRPVGLELPGVVEIQEVRLGSKIGGRVAEVLVAEGDTVEAGQLLVRYEVPDSSRRSISNKPGWRRPRPIWRRPKMAPAPKKLARPAATWKAPRRI